MTNLRLEISKNADAFRASGRSIGSCISGSGTIDRASHVYQVGAANGVSDWECALLQNLLEEGDLEDKEFKVCISVVLVGTSVIG